MGHVDRAVLTRVMVAATLLAMLAVALPVPSARAEVLVTPSPEGELLVVAVNAKQRELHEGRLTQLADGLLSRTGSAPDAILVGEIIKSNAIALRDKLNAATPDDVAFYRLVGITTNSELPTSSNIKVKILLNTATMEFKSNVFWADVCAAERTYQLVTAQERLADGTLGRPVALAGVHFAPSFNNGGSVECKQQNAAEARRQMAEHADSGIMGDFNRRAASEYYECNTEELGALEEWYDTMTGPSAVDGRSYRDTVRATHFGNATMAQQWSFESETTETLCTGAVGHKRSRLDYIFVSDEMSPISAGVDQGWGSGAPGEPGCSPAPDCKYSDHRFVWAHVDISTHASTPARPTGLSATAPAEYGRLDLTWQPSAGATGYDVYRYDAHPSVRTWVKIGATGATTFTDTGLADGSTYHYRVVATDGTGHSRPSVLAAATTATPAPNTPPAATITDPAGATHLVPGPDGTATLAVAATASDEDGDALASTWTASNPYVTFADRTALQTTATLPAGEHTLTFTADDGKSTTTDTVDVIVQPNTAPAVSITTPETGSTTVTADSTGTARVDLAADATDEPGALTWSWSTTSATGVTFDDAGAAATTATLGIGAHELKASATDGFGATGSATVTVTVEKAPSYTEATTGGESAVAGSVSDTHTATHGDDDVVQTITEVSSGGKPANRHQYLEHRWSVDVPAGDSVIVSIDAATTATDDRFAFAYSTDNGATYAELATVTNTTAAAQEGSIPGFTGGPLLLRVTDANRARGETTADAIAVDHILVRSHRTEAPPATPEPAMSTPLSESAIRVTWADVSGESAYEVEHTTTDPATGTAVWIAVATTGSDVTETTHSGLTTGTTHWYRVRATNAFGSSGWTSPVSATPSAAPPSRPMTITLTGSSTSKPKGLWTATVTATAVDDTGAAVPGATVSHRWDSGTMGSCTTGPAGDCSVSQDSTKQQSAVTYTVTGATPPDSTVTYTLPDPPPSLIVNKP